MENSSLQEKIGRTIQKIRKERHISQEKLALEAGVDRRYLSDVENGKRNLSVEIIERIADYFGINVSEIFAIAETIDLRTKSVKELKYILNNNGYSNSIIFENPGYLDAIIGISENGRVIYSYQKMVHYLMTQNEMSAEDASKFINIKVLEPLLDTDMNSPIVMNEINNFWGKQNMNQETINENKSFAAFYFSKFNEKAKKALGYSTFTEAFRDISIRLGGPDNSYLKMRRDEFDVFFNNGREGYNKRPVTEAVQQYYNKWDGIPFEKFTEQLKKMLEK